MHTPPHANTHTNMHTITRTRTCIPNRRACQHAYGHTKPHASEEPRRGERETPTHAFTAAAQQQVHAGQHERKRNKGRQGTKRRQARAGVSCTLPSLTLNRRRRRRWRRRRRRMTH